MNNLQLYDIENSYLIVIIFIYIRWDPNRYQGSSQFERESDGNVDWSQNIPALTIRCSLESYKGHLFWEVTQSSGAVEYTDCFSAEE